MLQRYRKPSACIVLFVLAASAAPAAADHEWACNMFYELDIDVHEARQCIRDTPATTYEHMFGENGPLYGFDTWPWHLVALATGAADGARTVACPPSGDLDDCSP